MKTIADKIATLAAGEDPEKAFKRSMVLSILRGLPPPSPSMSHGFK